MKTIGDIAQEVLDEVRSSKLTKLAELEVLKNASAADHKNEIARTLHKLAMEVRANKIDVSVEDVVGLAREIVNA